MSGHIHITPLGGISGDMFVAGMLDLFPEFEKQTLSKTKLICPKDNAFTENISKNGIRAKCFKVPEQPYKTPIFFADMDKMLRKIKLPVKARSIARKMLRLLAEAESKVHETTIKMVHFHEIADWDTLADLVSAAFLISLLDDWSWSTDPLPLGSGTIRTRHGLLSVPAPATSILLKGLPVHDDGISGERITPTGAVIIHYIMNYLKVRSRPMGLLRATGYGAGTSDLPGLANVLILQAIDGKIQDKDSVSILEWDIDDMTGEEIAVSSDYLRLCEGVIDLVTIAVSGKKGRPATVFRMLVRPGFADMAAQAVFTQTSTLGIRVRDEQRFILPRDLNGGQKTAIRPFQKTTKPESDNFLNISSLAQRRLAAGDADK